jgi:hypothetical protein
MDAQLLTGKERFPFKWNHLKDKNSLKIKELEHYSASIGTKKCSNVLDESLKSFR